MSSGGVGVCISALGPGSTALVNGVAAAHLDRLPMLAISGQIGTAKEPYFTHQVVEHERLFAPITKWAGRVDPASVATIMRKALRLATAERTGAVHLTTNADVAKTEASDAEVTLPPLAPAAVAPQVFRVPGAPDPVEALGRAPAAGAARRNRRGAGRRDPAARATGRGFRHPRRGLADGQGRVPRGPSAVRRGDRHGVQIR